MDRPVAVDLTTPAREQTRARQPDESGYVEREGVKLHYEVYGTGEPTVLLLPTWSIIHSRHWKMQIPYLARHCRVLTFDGRGNGRSDRPATGYAERDFAADALAVMDATATDVATIVSLSLGAQRGLLLAAEQPDRIGGAVFICPAVPLGTPLAPRAVPWDAELDTDEGWAKYNRYYWLRDYRGFVEFFFSQMFTEPHSTKPIEDCVGWALETTPETLVAAQLAEQARRAGHAGPVPSHPLPGARDPGHRGRHHRRRPRHRARRGDRRRAGPARRLRARPARARPGEGQPAAARRHRASRTAGALDARQGPPQAGALHLLADRPRARTARRGDRGRAAQAAPGPRDRLARAASGDGGARGTRRACPSRQRLARQRVRPHRERVGRARPPLLPGDPPDGRDPARQLHGLPRHRPRGRLRPLDRRRGVGARLLPAREPRAEALRLRLAHRLRRLAADDRWRRARGVPDRRLQRRDDRAHRALPTGARPRDLRRQPRRRGGRRVRPRPPADPGVDASSTTTSPATSPGSIRAAPGIAQPSATATTSRSASSPSAARESERTCCGA